MPPSTPIVKHLVLVGGGHAHALVIRMWAMNPLIGVRLILISPNWQTPYSGMLPGLLAGHYESDDIHIDLRRVCTWAKVRFIESNVLGLNPHEKSLQLSDHPDIHYDTLSIDIGSTPDMSIPGLQQFAQAVKPIDLFYPRFQACLERCRTAGSLKSEQVFRILIVGGGAGGIEVAFAMAEALSDMDSKHLSITLAVRGSELLVGYPRKISHQATKTLHKMNIKLVTNFDVQQVKQNKVISSTGLSIEANELFFCTQAKAALWPSLSGLECDERGFISVNPKLQSLNEPAIFAAGDIAHMQANPRPKAGVYAVRQAPILFENLKAHLLNEELEDYIPQESFLSLLSLGKKKALAAKNKHTLCAPVFQAALWRLKHAIDTKFMGKFKELPLLEMPLSSTINPALIVKNEQLQIKNHKVRCAGCGSKVGNSILRKVLSEVMGVQTFSPEDAAIFNTPQTQLIQTVDQITSPIDNPYLFGKLACLHALSDAFAMNSKPVSVQVLLNLPYAAEHIQSQEMRLVMLGVTEILKQHKCQLIGGHTSEAKELSLGFVVNALPYEDKTIFKKANLKTGDTLVVSKAIGTGVIMAGKMLNLTRGDWYQSALENMLTSNQATANLFSEFGVSACTDITGFGLAGHLCEMLEASQCKAELNVNALPLLNGASELSQQGIRSSLFPQNSEISKPLSISESVSQHTNFPLLFDPQTSGGLLAGLSPRALELLRQQSEIEFYEVGKVVEGNCLWDLKLQ